MFLRDILELLHSPKWSRIWDDFGSAPWKAAGPSFQNFQGGHSERCAIEISMEIRKLYPRFETRLRSAVADGKIATTYVFGNHDYMVQLSQPLRELLVGFLSLAHDPRSPFRSCYTDEASSVFATHGHQADAVNWHRPEDGLWAMGDAVVLRVVNRFAERACEVLGLAPATRL